MTLGPWELIVILVIVLLVFGAGRLSDVGGALGKGVREFRKATADTPQRAAASPTTPTAITSAPPLVVAPPVTTPAATEAEVVCPSCATPNPAGQSFCGQCGIRLVRAA